MPSLPTKWASSSHFLGEGTRTWGATAWEGLWERFPLPPQLLLWKAGTKVRTSPGALGIQFGHPARARQEATFWPQRSWGLGPALRSSSRVSHGSRSDQSEAGTAPRGPLPIRPGAHRGIPLSLA